MSAKTQDTPKQAPDTSEAKGSQKPLGLATPEPTPAVEDGRVQADQEKTAAPLHQLPEALSPSPAETKENNVGVAASDASAHIAGVDLEIKRILGCSDTSYAEILQVKPDSTETEKIIAWRRLGCLLHEKSTNHKDAATAFKKLQNAAEKQGLQDLDIDEVVTWDGEEELPDLNPDPVEPMDIDTAIPAPPTVVTNIYEKATPVLYQLLQNSTDLIALKQLQNLNAEISAFNAEENKNNRTKFPLDRWCIPQAFFCPHYSIVQENYSILVKDRTNQAARNAIAKEKHLIDTQIGSNHFPRDWSVETADHYLQNKDKAAATAEAIDLDAGKATTKSPGTIDYPWTTAKAANGSLIIGVRKQGFGSQVCTEKEENGKIIRRLESASEAGLLEVKKYWEMKDHKNLAEGQSQWSYKNREDFEELLWVTKSQTKRKNVAANKKDPSADCCVKFKKKGIQILTVTSFNKVLGPSSARAKIEEVCIRDKISPPWKAGHVSEYNDPSKVEKDPVRRRALRDAQAALSIDNHWDQRERSLDRAVGQESRVTEQLEDRVKSLEREVKDLKGVLTLLNQNMESLMGMFKAPKEEEQD